MAKNKPTVSPRAPFENVEETLETPDIAAFRGYTPDTTMLSSALKARFDKSRQQVRDSYGGYSGIPSQVARNAMRDESLRELDESEGLALAEGNERAQALQLAQLETLAGLTQKRKQSGFKTEVSQPQQSSFWPSLFGGVASGLSMGLSARSAQRLPQSSLPKITFLGG